MKRRRSQRTRLGADGNSPHGSGLPIGALGLIVGVPLLIAGALLLLGRAPPVALAQGKKGAASETDLSVAERMLQHLRAANEARSTLAREDQKWREEKERLLLIEDSLRREIEALRREEEAARSEAAEITRQLAALETTQERRVWVESLLMTAAKRIEERLDALTSSSLPGVVPPKPEVIPIEGADRIAEAIRRLASAEGGARSFAVEIVGGQRDGKEQSVRLLRVGGAAAWWISLDGDDAGTARMVDGVLLLSPAPDQEQAKAIRRAVAVAEGRRAPEWISLPMGHVKATYREPNEDSR